MPVFHRHVTLNRFVHARDPETAHEIAHRGMQIIGNMVAEPFASIETTSVHTAVYPYLHAGEDDDMWQASIKVSAQLRAADASTASEAAHQLVTVDPVAARDDAFEFEIKVVSCEEHPMRRAG